MSNYKKTIHSYPHPTHSQLFIDGIEVYFPSTVH